MPLTVSRATENVASFRSSRTARRPASTAIIGPALREERYRKAEARLIQSFLSCKDEPSAHELQLRTLERTTRMLAHFAEDSHLQAKELAAMTSSRAKVANLDPASYQSLLSRRWKAQRHQDLISQNMKALQQTIDSLAPMPSGAGSSLLLDGHEDQVLSLENRTYNNLVTFLCCPQRVAPLHHRSRSRLYNFYLRPLYLDAPAASPTIATRSPRILMQSTTTDTSSDTSLDMHVQTPVVTDSLIEQQARFTINDDEAGTATILTQPLPKAPLPDPANVKVELPDYVHELLADFDAQDRALSPSSAAVRFQPNDSRGADKRKGGFWPFRRSRKDRGSKYATAQPELRSKSSFRKLSGFMTASETSTLRKKVNPTGGGSPITLTNVSESGSRGESDSSKSSSASPNKVISRMASNIARRISFSNLKV